MLTGNENHNITFTDAGKLTKKYRDTIPLNEIIGGYFGRAAIETLLAQTACVGIRYYYGINTDDKKVLVIVGVDRDGNDLADPNTNVCKEISLPCPTLCSSPNALNS